LKNWIDPEDLCTAVYRAYVDSLREILHQSGARIDLALAGHEHSLQLLAGATHDPACRNCPSVHIISGAGSKPSRVKFPHPPFEYTSVEPDFTKKGISQTGFVQLKFSEEAIRVVFFNGMTGDRIDMGGGKDVFWIGPDGSLRDRGPATER
jgi:hypothetical protein